MSRIFRLALCASTAFALTAALQAYSSSSDCTPSIPQKAKSSTQGNPCICCCKPAAKRTPAVSPMPKCPADPPVACTTNPLPVVAPAKACDVEKEQYLLGGAQSELRNLRSEKAASAFKALFDSCDDKTQAKARLGFNDANEQMSTWWWLEGRYVPPLRWWHHPRFWQAVRRTLLIIGIILLLLWPFFYLTDLRLFHWVTLPTGHVFRKLRQGVLVERLPRASIMTPLALTENTQAKLFGALLENASEDVRRVLERAGGGLQVRATALLALPSDTTSQLVDALPKVKGVDVASWVKFFFFLKRYLGWRIESQIGYCPSTKSSDGITTAARVVASASLRHAFWVRGGPWPVERCVLHAYDVDSIAFAIVARIMGFNMKGSRVQ